MVSANKQISLPLQCKTPQQNGNHHLGTLSIKIEDAKVEEMTITDVVLSMILALVAIFLLATLILLMMILILGLVSYYHPFTISTNFDLTMAAGRGSYHLNSNLKGLDEGQTSNFIQELRSKPNSLFEMAGIKSKNWTEFKSDVERSVDSKMAKLGEGPADPVEKKELLTISGVNMERGDLIADREMDGKDGELGGEVRGVSNRKESVLVKKKLEPKPIALFLSRAGVRI